MSNSRLGVSFSPYLLFGFWISSHPSPHVVGFPRPDPVFLNFPITHLAHRPVWPACCLFAAYRSSVSLETFGMPKERSIHFASHLPGFKGSGMQECRRCICRWAHRLFTPLNRSPRKIGGGKVCSYFTSRIFTRLEGHRPHSGGPWTLVLGTSA